MRSKRLAKNLMAVVVVSALSCFPLMARPPASQKPVPKKPPALILPVPSVLGDLMGPLPSSVLMAAAGLTTDLTKNGPVQFEPPWPWSGYTVVVP